MSKTNILNNKSNLSDYYKLLNVPDNATMEEITRAYLTIDKDYENLKMKHQALKKQIEGEISIYQKAYKILTSRDEKDKFDLQVKSLELRKKAENQIAKTSVKQPENSDNYCKSDPSVFQFSKFKIVIPDSEQLNKLKKIYQSG